MYNDGKDIDSLMHHNQQLIHMAERLAKDDSSVVTNFVNYVSSYVNYINPFSQ